MTGKRWEAVTAANCALVRGPFYHGTRAELSVGDLLTPGHPSNYEQDRVLRHIYFSGLLEPAIWGAELAIAYAKSAGRGSIYIVAPTGGFEDDPNLTNKRFPGNPTKSYRTQEPLTVIGIVEDWQGHSAQQVRAMVDSLTQLRRRGLALIED